MAAIISSLFTAYLLSWLGGVNLAEIRKATFMGGVCSINVLIFERLDFGRLGFGSPITAISAITRDHGDCFCLGGLSS
jgi:hypothetical protein